MNFIVKISRFYNRKIFPKIESLRGATFLSRQLSKLALKTVDKEKNIEIDGLTLSNKIYNLDNKVARKVLTGSYEQDELKLAEDIDFNQSVVELGGGVGYIACIIDDKLPKKYQHIVLEPNSQVTEVLRHNKQLNDSKFDIVEKAYSYRNEEVELEIEGVFWGGRTSLKKNKGSVRKVEAVSLGEIFSEFEIGDFILVSDIEGAEYDLIDHEFEKFSKAYSIMVELHDSDKKINSAVQKITAEGYELKNSSNDVFLFGKL